MTISNEQILDAARAVFLERGYGASTVEIARVAGVSEATLFKRFDTKDTLFFAALGLPLSAPWVEGLKVRVGRGDMRSQLSEVGLQLALFFRDLLPRLTLMWSCRMSSKEGIRRQSVNGSHPSQESIRALGDYFAAEMRLGRLRRSDPQVVVRMFAGAIYHFVSMEMMLEQPPKATDAKNFVTGLVDNLWLGLRPTAD